MKVFNYYTFKFSLLKYDITRLCSFRCSTQWLDIYTHHEIIITINLVTICRHTKLLQYYWPYTLCHIYFVTVNLCLLTRLPIKQPHPHPSQLWQPFVCSLYLWVSLFPWDPNKISPTWCCGCQYMETEFHSEATGKPYSFMGEWRGVSSCSNRGLRPWGSNAWWSEVELI